MATEAQIAANRRNALASTGPRTEEGKARVAGNATTLGLFAVRGFIRPGEEEEYARLCATLSEELHPLGLIEETLVTEIIHATWRLQRCSKVEHALSQLLDPMENLATEPTQDSVDRARAQAQRSLLRLIAELRRLQAGRQIRDEDLPENLASPIEMARARLTFRKLDGLADFESIFMAGTAPPPRRPEITEQTRFPAVTARSAPCPCGSGVKYKRCCGVNAPAVLSNLSNLSSLSDAA